MVWKPPRVPLRLRSRELEMTDILIGASSCTQWTPELEYGLRLSSLLGNVVTAAYAGEPEVQGTSCNGRSHSAVSGSDQFAVHASNPSAVSASFVERAHASGIAHARWRNEDGELSFVLQRLGAWHDLLVIGGLREPDFALLSALGGLILSVGMPCVVVPAGLGANAQPQCVALAWNGAVEAIRAIHASIPLLTRARRVVVLDGGRRESRTRFSWMPPFDLAAHLGRRRIRIEQHPITATDSMAGEALLKAADEVGADMLVMGAYGRSRFSEWLLGGATRHVLEYAELPLFMRH
jgi:nucleotide-binding universal stress UspA family protein